MSSLIKRPITKSSGQGITLIEVLITLVIMGIGLLGVAQMQTLSLKSNFDSDQRVIASNLASDILARLRSVPTSDLNTYFGADVNTIDISTPSDADKQACPMPAPSPAPTPVCTIAQKLQYDIDQIIGSTDLFNGDACLTMSGNLLTITIAWDGIGKLEVTPTTTCGEAAVANKRRSLTVETLL